MVAYSPALEQAKKYFNGDELAATTFLGKYALTTPSGDILEPTPTQMHERLAKEFARIEAKYPNPVSEKTLFTLLDHFKDIIPQGSPMSGIGNPFQTTSLSNCFVIESPEDSYGGIMYTDQQEAQLMKRRGGVGFDVSTIRPKGLLTNNAAKTTDGIGIFMERFSNTCREVAQGGRRGALMLSISVHHPEIRTFINIKKDLKKVTGANISIRITDEFMRAVKAGKEVQLRFPVDEKQNPTVTSMVDASKLWDEIIDAAHNFAEPGLLFWDTVLDWCPTTSYPDFISISTNPCGEITLSKFDSCRLLLVNALTFVRNAFAADSSFDWARFESVVRVAQRLMDDLVELELECVDKILAKIDLDPESAAVKLVEKELWQNVRKACANGRRTGLGVTAIGDMCAAMGLRYGSEESIEFVEKVYKTLCMASYRESVNLAKERGAFPVFSLEQEKGNKFLDRIWEADPELYKEYVKYGRRNIANLTTAPAGTVSICSQTTSGIEPVFLVSYKRRKKINPNDKQARVDYVDDLGDKWQEFRVFHHGFRTWAEVNGKTDLLDKGDEMVEELVRQSPYHKATANDVDWVSKVKLQAAAQKWIDHSISNTTNIPNETPIEVTKQIYMTGWELGCKGVTVYRDGSRSGVLVSDKPATKPTAEGIVERHAAKRPSALECDVYHSTVGGEKWTLFVGLIDGKPYEVMGGLAKHIKLPKRVKQGKIIKRQEADMAKYDFHYDYESPESETIIQDVGNIFEDQTNSAFSRVLSLSLRHGAPVQYVVEQLIKGSDKDSDLFSYSRVMSRVLKPYIKDGTKPSQKKCDSCKSTNLAFQQGCATCLDCGFSKCG
jgi:ribonucleoside-diphosphate reductase alpha chain